MLKSKRDGRGMLSGQMKGSNTMEHQIVLKIILTAVGLLTTAALTYTGRQVAKAIAVMRESVKDIGEMKKLNAAQSENIVSLSETLCCFAESQNEVIIALKNFGLNGQTKNAFEMLDKGKRVLEEQEGRNRKRAMGVI